MSLRTHFWIALALLGVTAGVPAAAAPPAQAPTATPPDVRIEVFQETVNVRTGPGTEYDMIGVLIPGQTSQVIGRSLDGSGVKIIYIGGPDNTGWVNAPNVRVVGELSTVPTLEPPPTPTRRPTATAEIFGTEGGPTPAPQASRLPTYTPHPVEIQPTLLPVQGVAPMPAFPPAVLIITLLVLGSFGGLLSLLRGRR